MLNKILIAILLGTIVFNSSLQAQILHEMVSRFDYLRNLTYKMTIKEKPPMSGEVSTDTLTASFAFSNGQELFNVIGQRAQEVYDGRKLIKIDLNNHTYTITKGIKGSTVQHKMLPYIIHELKKDLIKNAPVRMQKDNVINDTEYFHLTITSRDTVIKDKKVYLIRELLIDKKSYLPVYYRSEQQGFVDGTDFLVDVYDEMYFFDYYLNRKDFTAISEFKVPSSFSIEVPQKRKPPLSMGTKAPELHLKDINENIFKLEKQKGKVILLNFTSTNCSHGAEAISMLNDLYLKYGKKNFAIVTINPPYDDKEAIKIYNKKGNVKYPIYISNDLHNLNSYNVYDFPTFYLIDKNGNVIQALGGYSDTTKKQLEDIIKQHL